LDVLAGGKLTFDTNATAESLIGGNGLALARGGKMQLQRGRLRLDAPMVSDGIVNMTGGRIDFSKAGAVHRMGGEGLRMGASSELRLDQGMLRMTGPLNSVGRINISAQLQFDSSQDSSIGGQGMQLGTGGRIDFKKGRVKFNAPLSSDGFLNISGGNVDFNNGTHRVGCVILCCCATHVVSLETVSRDEFS
jgi:hypothetical protein